MPNFPRSQSAESIFKLLVNFQKNHPEEFIRLMHMLVDEFMPQPDHSLDAVDELMAYGESSKVQNEKEKEE
jgi:hypothetical protein